MKKISVLTIAITALLLLVMFIDLYSLSKNQPATTPFGKNKSIGYQPGK